MLQIANEHFVITAAHVEKLMRKLAQEHGIGTWLSAKLDDKELVPLQRLPSRVLTVDEQLDVCVMKLENKDAKDLELAGARFLRLSQTNPHDQPEKNGWYLLMGLIASDQGAIDQGIRNGIPHFTLETSVFAYLTLPFEPVEDVLDYNARAHRALKYPNTGSLGENGEPMNQPDPRGLSGSGVWRITDDRDSILGLRSDNLNLAERARLMGIQFSAHPKKGYVKVTRFYVVLDLIRKQWPELDRLIQLSMYPAPPPIIQVVKPTILHRG